MSRLPAAVEPTSREATLGARRFELSAGARPWWHGIRYLVVDMKILCAWCCRDGLPGYMGEREPLDNPEPTHGICAYHKAEVLESLPSHTFPDVQLLVIVRQGNTALYERLRWSFGALSGVRVIVDRRVSERRAAPWQESGRRRHARTRRIREASISSLDDFTVLRFTPKVPPTPALELDQRMLADKAFAYAAELVDAEHSAPAEEAAVLTAGGSAPPRSPQTDTAF